MKAHCRTIGQLARETGVGVETIRFYERRGLLKQPKRSAEGGYRHYDNTAVQLVRYIRLAQQLSLTLKDVERLLARVDGSESSFCEAVRSTVEQKIAEVRDEQVTLHARELQLATFLRDCRNRSRNLPCPILAGIHSTETKLP